MKTFEDVTAYVNYDKRPSTLFSKRFKRKMYGSTFNILIIECDYAGLLGFEVFLLNETNGKFYHLASTELECFEEAELLIEDSSFWRYMKVYKTIPDNLSEVYTIFHHENKNYRPKIFSYE